MVVYCGIADLSLNDKFPGVCKLVTKEEVTQRVSEQGGEALQRGLSLDFTKGVLEFGHDPVVGEEKCPYVQVGSPVCFVYVRDLFKVWTGVVEWSVSEEGSRRDVLELGASVKEDYPYMKVILLPFGSGIL